MCVGVAMLIKWLFGGRCYLNVAGTKETHIEKGRDEVRERKREREGKRDEI